MNFQLEVTEVYQVIGELEMVRRKCMIQIEEMSREIERLRAENGRLVQAANNVELPELRGRSEEQGHRLDYPSAQSRDQSSSGLSAFAPEPSEVSGVGREQVRGPSSVA